MGTVEQIVLSDQAGQQVDVTENGALKVSLDDVNATLRYIANLLARPIYVEPGSARMKVTVDAGTLPTVTTVGTVTSVAQIDGFDGKDTMLNSLDRNLWYNSVRTRIV